MFRNNKSSEHLPIKDDSIGNLQTRQRLIFKVLVSTTSQKETNCISLKLYKNIFIRIERFEICLKITKKNNLSDRIKTKN